MQPATAEDDVVAASTVDLVVALGEHQIVTIRAPDAITISADDEVQPGGADVGRSRRWPASPDCRQSRWESPGVATGVDSVFA